MLFRSYYRNYTSDIPFKNGDGLYKAYVKATDKAGITSENLGTFVNKIDTTSPVLGTVSIPAFAQDGINKAEKENLSETPFTLSVSVSDVSSKVKQFKVYRDSTEITENVAVSPAVSAADGIYADGEYVFTVSENSIGTTGKYKFSITAVDFAGNEATVSSSTVTVDLDEPVISSFNEKQNAVEIDGVNYWNGIITVTGNVSDDELTAGENGIVSWALYTKSGENYTPLSGNGTSGSTKLNGSGTVTNAVFSFTIDTTLADSTENGGDYYLKVSVKDKCGNVSQTAYTLLKIRQSTDKPEISFSNANPSLL